MLHAALTTHGSDDNGLICGFRFSAGQAAQPLASLAAGAEALGAPAGGFTWVHMNLSHAGAERWLRTHAGLSEGFFDALLEGSRSTRIERDGEALFAVMNDLSYEFSLDSGDLATLWIEVHADRVVSVRRHPLRAVDRLRTAVQRGVPLRSSVALLDQLLREQADELQRIVRRAAERLDDIEDALLAGRHHDHGQELARLRRLAVRLQRLLAPEPSALMRTLARPPSWISPSDLQDLHQSNEEFALVLRDVAALQERIKLMQDEAATRVSEENNRSLFVLTMVTVLALPINLTSGLMGMNVGGVPLADAPRGFWLMVGFIAALTGVIAWLALRRWRRRG